MNSTSIIQYFRKILNSVISLLERLILKVYKNRNFVSMFFADHFQTSFEKSFSLGNESLASIFINNINLEPYQEGFNWLPDVSKNYIDHRFDLLGSGWTHVFHGLNPRGLEGYRYHSTLSISVDQDGNWLNGFINKSNLTESKCIWKLIDNNYHPIDWQIDFKSGYRWSEKTPSKSIVYGKFPGADVIIPWELARLQHLPQLSWAFAFSKKSTLGYLKSNDYLQEFRNEVLDFISTNPPHWGVNWNCSMDVAIRAANMLIAYDLFKNFGAEFDSSFISIFTRSIYEHGKHIFSNLEWHPRYRTNHYLSNIVGLIFISAYLPSNDETNLWLKFSISELIKEVNFQFHKDGSNFEASTSYHRLSSELVIFATAIVIGLNQERVKCLQNFTTNKLKVPFYLPIKFDYSNIPGTNKESPFPSWYFSTLVNMAKFTVDITKPDGHIVQVGDNDSGRVLKMFPIFDKFSVIEAKTKYKNLNNFKELGDTESYWMEDHLDYRHLIASINGLFNMSSFDDFSDNYVGLNKLIVESICGGLKISTLENNKDSINFDLLNLGFESTWINNITMLDNFPGSSLITLFPLNTSIGDEEMVIQSYPDFGEYIFKSDHIYLAVHCGAIGQNGFGGHSHNDQLSIELVIDGKTIITDPGTYIYTPLINKRNEYRSVKSHFAPQIDSKEPGNLLLNTFRNSDPKAEVLYFGKKGFIGKHKGYGSSIFRKIEILPSVIMITDYSEKDVLISTNQQNIHYSPGYGIIFNEGYS